VLAEPRATGLTDAESGKTHRLARSRHVMSTPQIRPRSASQPLRSAPSPDVDVLEWRASRLRDAGFEADLAATLAGQRVDLHALLSLVDAGCPPDLAARILSPDEGPGERG
jgi:hypothetical protein